MSNGVTIPCLLWPTSTTSASQKASKEKRPSCSILSTDEKAESCHIQFNESLAETNRSTNKQKTVVGTTMFSISRCSRSDLGEALRVRPHPATSEEEWGGQADREDARLGRPARSRASQSSGTTTKTSGRNSSPPLGHLSLALSCNLHAARCTCWELLCRSTDANR